MPKYLIGRRIPDAGQLTARELKASSQKACGVLREMGPRIPLVHSHLTGDPTTAE